MTDPWASLAEKETRPSAWAWMPHKEGGESHPNPLRGRVDEIDTSVVSKYDLAGTIAVDITEKDTGNRWRVTAFGAVLKGELPKLAVGDAVSIAFTEYRTPANGQNPYPHFRCEFVRGAFLDDDGDLLGIGGQGEPGGGPGSTDDAVSPDPDELGEVPA
jgi:hypothetical protein